MHSLDHQSIWWRLQCGAWGHAFGIGVMLCALAFVITFGVVGIGRGPEALTEIYFYYPAGMAWLDGQSMYEPQVYAEMAASIGVDKGDYGFPYAPSFAPIAMALASVEIEHAKWIMWTLHTASLAMIAGSLAWWMRHPQHERPATHTTFAPWLIAAIAVGLPFTAHCVWMGQATLWAWAMVITGWTLAAQQRHWAAGVLLGLASFKLPVLLLPGIWLLLTGRWRVIGMAAAVGIAMAAYPIVLLGPVELVQQWLASMQGYQHSPVNTLGEFHVTGVPSVLASAGGPALSVYLMLTVAAAAIAGMWWYRERLILDDVFGVLLVLQPALVYGHDYEFTYGALLIGALWLHVAHRPRLWPVLIVGLLVLCFPQRFVRPHLPLWAAHWRTPLMLLAAGWGLWLSARSVSVGARPPVAESGGEAVSSAQQ